jgi:hypothetical protein
MCRPDELSSLKSYFRVGSLRFGVHGVLGALCLAWTLYNVQTTTAATTKATTSGTNLGSVLSCQAMTLYLVLHARQLLPQVPAQSQILPGIVAPHREAFQRTIAVMLYLVGRIVTKLANDQVDMYWGSTDSAQTAQQFTRALTYCVLIWLWLPLVPTSKLNLGNGNTWIFVVPIAFGITGDMYQHVVYGDCFTVQQLAHGQVLGLCLAFGFTLAFRRILPMGTVYLGAAIGVWWIIQEGIRSAS